MIGRGIMIDMRKLALSGGMLMVSLLLLVAGSMAADEKTKQPQPSAVAAASVAKPVYKPPLRGAPAGRVGGGTRGATERESFSLLVLAPDHVGYTVKEQPCLYWFISKPTSYPVEITVTERKAVKPLLEKVLNGSGAAGIQSICLADHGVGLKKDVTYKWFVTLVTDSTQRSRDILAGGILERSAPSAALSAKLQGAERDRVPFIYAEEGFWYDALGSVTDLINASPGNRELRSQRCFLLDQVGLTEAAAFEKQLTAP
jgi:hypothetical protein